MNANFSHRRPVFGVIHLCLAASVFAAFSQESTVITPLETFDRLNPGPIDKGHIDFWRWSGERRQQAKDWSRLEIVAAPENAANRRVRVIIKDPEVFADGPKPILRLADYFPPEADGVRLRLRVVSGSFSLHVGGPTAYYGNSDVWTLDRTVRAEETTDWIDLDLSLNHPLRRNFRRAGFSAEATRIAYQRWAQEPLGVYLGTGSQGELLIDRIDLVTMGEGRPFPEFSESEREPVRCLADFEDGDLDPVATLYFAAAESEWFEESWRRSRPLRFQPMALSIAPTGPDGGKVLECRGPTAEEVHATALVARGDAKANAVALTVKVDAPERRETLAGGTPVAPIDILVFTSTSGGDFPWESLAPSAEWRALGGRGFDYQFTHRVIAGRTDLDFAIHHTRRYLTPGEWTRLCLPASDFVCLYGQGTMKQRLLDQAPLAMGEIIALAWVNPWARVGRRDAAVTTSIDRIDLVRVPGSPESHRSFWQAPDVKQLLIRTGSDERGQREQFIGLPGDLPPGLPE